MLASFRITSDIQPFPRFHLPSVGIWTVLLPEVLIGEQVSLLLKTTLLFLPYGFSRVVITVDLQRLLPGYIKAGLFYVAVVVGSR